MEYPTHNWLEFNFVLLKDTSSSRYQALRNRTLTPNKDHSYSQKVGPDLASLKNQASKY
jgi:hypothetical protein